MDYDFGVNILQNDGRIGQLLGKLQKVAISIGIFDIYGTLQKKVRQTRDVSRVQSTGDYLATVATCVSESRVAIASPVT